MKALIKNSLCLLIFAAGCQACSENSAGSSAANQQILMTPVPVELRHEEGRFQLYRGGEPYFIKGAGGRQHLDKLAAYGGNSIRTWSTNNAQQVLDEAFVHDLTVTLGLHVERERHGFDYNDEAAVAVQLDELREVVRAFKDHPSLLMWGIGNELNLHYENPKVWDAVNDIALMIHEEDPHHPVTTMLAGVNRKEIKYIKERCPDLDLLAVNAYGDLPKVPQKLRMFGWDSAYVVTEWGPTGHWEVGETAWGAPIEETSRQKAALYKSRYEASIEQDKGRCLGSYVFLWGQKQERTPTWYGLFTEEGHETEVVDVMHYLWTDYWPSNQAPRLDAIQLDSMSASDNIYLTAGAQYYANVEVTDPEEDPLSYRWELLPESTDLKEGGDPESRPQALKGLFREQQQAELQFRAPAREGAYRLFVYVSDPNNKVATANIPFYVRQE